MDEQQHGALGLSPAVTRAVLTTTGLAPSLHNTQPWRFRVRPDTITLLADRTHLLPVTDPHDRELRIACGAALLTLRLALHGHGIRAAVALLPEGEDSDVIAVVRTGEHQAPTPEQSALLAAVPRRHTNRRPFSDAPVTPPEQHALQRAAQAEDSWLHVVADAAERSQLRDLAVTAHRHQMADPRFRAELDHWTAVAPGSPDGVPASAGGPLPSPTTGWVHRDFAGGSAGTGQPFEAEPLLAVLTSHLTGARAEVQAGQALQRLLLTATTHGLTVSFLSQIVEVEQTRRQLRSLVHGARAPQVVLRIGHGFPVGATPRRAVTDLIAAPPEPAPTGGG